MAEREAETHVLFVGQTGVGKSTLINMIRGVRDNTPTAAKVSYDAAPCTQHTMSYSVQLETGLHCQLWDTRGLDEVDNRDRLYTAKIVSRIRLLASQQERELKETIRNRTRTAKPILMWCIDATKIDVPTHWQQFRKVYMEYCEEMAIPVVVINRMHPNMTGWEPRCINQLQMLDLVARSGTDVHLLRVRKHRNVSSLEYREDCQALRDLISRIMEPERLSSPVPSRNSGLEQSRARARKGNVLDDTNEATPNPSSKGASRGVRSRLPDPSHREPPPRLDQPEQVKKAIHAIIKDAICDSPLVLINTTSGRLCDKPKQAAAFESTTIFAELVSTTTTDIDHARIKKEVEKFYRYATLSHTWQGDEPLYDKVTKIVVYDLEASPTHDKLRMFCKIVREEGFNWAWSDTCCIDKGDHFVLQEALVSMYKWYEGSAMTIIFLFDVDELAKPDALMLCIWNTRGWTLQEYHASRVVRIYTKNWKPYLGLKIYNHKDSQVIISEMNRATDISPHILKRLHPGLDNIREKLRLASTRETTRVEDAAYSLLGIFSMSLPVTYGEGDKALGRLLSQLLMSSGDTSILAWTGRSGSFNSCLPATISVFKQPVASYVPTAISDAEMEATTIGQRRSPLDLDLVMRLHDQLNGLPIPFFVGQRMKLPCIVFKIRSISAFRDGSEVVFRAVAVGLGVVEIRTWQNLTQLDSLYLVHPWLDFLLGRCATGSGGEFAPAGHEYPELDELPPLDSLPELSSVADADDSASLVSPLVKDNTPFYQFLARLRRPFGALLLTPTRQNAQECRRVASDSLITAQVKETTPATLAELASSVRVLDLL